jgi:hypothetical protein
MIPVVQERGQPPFGLVDGMGNPRSDSSRPSGVVEGSKGTFFIKALQLQGQY